MDSTTADFKRCSGIIRAEFLIDCQFSMLKTSFNVSKPGDKEIWGSSFKDLQSLSEVSDADLMLDSTVRFLFYFGDKDEPVIENTKVLGTKCLQSGSELNADIPTGSATDYTSQPLNFDESKDAEIKCGEHSIKVHQRILRAQSEVFKEMLDSSMLKDKIGIVQIQDMDINFLQDFVQFLYTGAIPEPNFDKVKVLYEAGDKYAVRSLMLRCSKFLQDNLAQENAFQCIALAVAHSELELKDKVKNYILKEKMHLQDDTWMPFCQSYPAIALEVLNTLSRKRKISETEDI